MEEGKIELRPCPICGGEVHVRKFPGAMVGSTTFSIACENCGLMTRLAGTLLELLGVWNVRRRRRATPRLKGCPLCGGRAAMEEYGLGFFVTCEKCGTRTSWSFEKRKVVQSWNVRIGGRDEKK